MRRRQKGFRLGLQDGATLCDSLNCIPTIQVCITLAVECAECANNCPHSEKCDARPTCPTASDITSLKVNLKSPAARLSLVGSWFGALQ